MVRTSSTVRADKKRTSSEREASRFPARISFVRSVWSHHLSSPGPPNDTPTDSAGGSTLIRHTARGMSYRTDIPDTHQRGSREYTCSCLLQRLRCPLFLACLRMDSETVEPAEPPAAAMKAGLGCLCRLAMLHTRFRVKGQIMRNIIHWPSSVVQYAQSLREGNWRESRKSVLL